MENSCSFSCTRKRLLFLTGQDKMCARRSEGDVKEGPRVCSTCKLKIIFHLVFMANIQNVFHSRLMRKGSAERKTNYENVCGTCFEEMLCAKPSGNNGHQNLDWAIFMNAFLLRVVGNAGSMPFENGNINI